VGGNARVRGEATQTAATLLAPQPLAGIAASRQFAERFANNEVTSNQLVTIRSFSELRGRLWSKSRPVGPLRPGSYPPAPENQKGTAPHVAVRDRPKKCERSAIPLVLSWMIIYLTALAGHGPVLPGLRPTRACAPTWTCTVAEIARDIRPSPAGLRFSSSLRVQAPPPLAGRAHLPHRRLAPPGLTPCAIFCRLAPAAVPGSSSPRRPGPSGLWPPH
jgi:hypothetical protein